MVAKLTPVTVSLMQMPWALVSKGLSAGQTVVVEGQYRLEDGSKVRVEEASPSAGSSGAPGLGNRRGTGGRTNRPSTNPPPQQTGA
jgi:multidrug efflux system membrane fusion protein